MAQLFCAVVLVLCINYSFCAEIKLDKNTILYTDIIQLVSCILKNDSNIFASSAVSAFNVKSNSQDERYLIQLDIHATCYRNLSSGCESLDAICELNINSKSHVDDRALIDEDLRCAEKERRPVLPATDRGFVEVNADAEVRDIAEYAIRQLEEGGLERRSILDIVSIKKDSQPGGTRFYLTVKVTATDGGDASHLEVCELEVNQTSDVTLQSEGSCFPLGDAHDRPLSEEHVFAGVEKAVTHLNNLSLSSFLYSFRAVVNAEQAVTPGSEGVSSTYEVSIVPSVCLKAGGQEQHKCLVSDHSPEVMCIVTSWERPWLGDVLYSRPRCRVTADASSNTTTNAEATTPAEPEAELLVARGQEGTPIPVKEEPVLARHVYCVGCSVDLNLDNPALEEFTSQALVHIDNHSLSNYMHSVTRIIRAQKQVINGIRYTVYMEVLETSCLKGSETNRQLCEPKPDSEVKICVVEFIERPWLDSSKQIESNNCTEEVDDLENEIVPENIIPDDAEKQEILDFLDTLGDSDIETGFGDKNMLTNVKESNQVEPMEPTELPASERRSYLTSDDLNALSHLGESVEGKSELGMAADTSDPTQGQLAMPGGTQSTSTEEQDESLEESTESEEPASTSQSTKKANSETGCIESLSKDGKAATSQHDKKNLHILITTDRERRNAQVVGGLRDLDDSEKDLVNELAQTAVATLDEIDLDDMKRVVLEILDAKKQLVNGILYHLVIKVGYTHCKEDSSSPPDCMKDIVSSRICKVQLHHAFAGSKKAQVVQSECDGDAGSDLASSRARRSVVGGIQPVSVLDSDITRVAGTALLHLSQASTNFSNPPCIDTIQSASKQVVAGTLYRLTLRLRETASSGNRRSQSSCPPDSNSDTLICEMKVWEKLWENFFEVTDISCRPESRTRREVLVGGLSPVSVDDHNVQRLTSLAMTRLAQTSGSENKTLIRVVEAYKQVVAGVKWHITLEVCGEQNTTSETCKLEVVERLWLNSTDITNFTCFQTNTLRAKRSVAGNSYPVPVPPTNENVNEVARFALSQLDHTTTSPNAQFLVDIKEVHTQVVDGDKFYLLLLEVGESTCPKNVSAVGSPCRRLDNVPTQHCHVDVLVGDEQDSSSKQLVNSVCGPADTVSQHVKDSLANSVQRFKRSNSLLVGTPKESRPDEDYIQKLANFAVSELDKNSGSEFAMKKVRVVSARTQIVSGKLVHLTLEVGFSNCRKEENIISDQCELSSTSDIQVCHVSVWDQPWRKHREVKDASCDQQFSVHLLKKRATISRRNLLGQFETFMSLFNKTYSSKAEYKRRYHIFRANMKKVQLLQETELGTAKYGATQFSDLTAKEFKAMYLGLNVSKRDSNLSPLPMAAVPDVELPVDFDWRDYNAVTAVKNQGSCGSCWAFSVTGNVEGQWAINRGKLLSLSEQELVDCDKMDDGCSGGEMVNAYKAVEKLGGLETESEYPYEGANDQCHFNKTEVLATITGAVNITSNETQMAQWLFKNGPISIGINANAMQFYFGGVSHPWKILCTPDDLDHGVLIVGFGVHTYPLFHKSLPYWIVKNSWGPTWGEQGYYRVFRGDGTCGVNKMATSAIVV